MPMLDAKTEIMIERTGGADANSFAQPNDIDGSALDFIDAAVDPA
jgi:hypothetical protein